MPLDQARWQLDILAADKTAQAFASVDRRVRSLEQSNARLSASFNKQGQQGANALGMLAGGLGRLAPAVIAVSVAWRTWQAGMKSGELLDQAGQLGVTTDALQAYRLVAAQAGVDSQQFDGALQRLTGQMGQAAAGGDDAIARFDKLNVKLLDGEGRLRAVEDVLPEVARGLLAVGSETERNALAQELFGRSGSRVVTMLTALATGTAAVTQAARDQGAIVGQDQLEAWNKLDAQLKVTAASADAALASLGAPIATKALELVNKILTDILANLDRLKREAAAAPQRAAGADVKNLEDQLAAQRGLLAINPNNKMVQSSVAALERRLTEARQAALAADVTADVGGLNNGKLPLVGGNINLGKRQPTGKTAGAAGAKLDERLRELQNERRALETAMAAFDGSSGEGAAAIDKRLDAQVKLDKKIFDVLKDVPPNSPLAAQLTQEATAISQLNQQLDQRKKLLDITKGGQDFIAAQQLEQQTIGLSSEAVARLRYEFELLNKAKADGIPLTDAQRDSLVALAGQMAATEEVTRRAKEMNELYKDVFKGFVQGMVDGLREGKNVWEVFGDAALTALNKISDKLIDMAINDLFNNAFGGSGGGGSGSGLFGNIFSGLFSGAGSGFGAGGGVSGMTFADGGRPPVGRASIVGEKGWELFVPDRPGTIYNQDQLAAMGGGGRAIHITQNIQVGSFATRAEMIDMGRAIERSARTGAVAAVTDLRARGDRAVKPVFKR